MGTNFCVQVAEYLSGRNLNMVFSMFILWYVESKFTLLTYLTENNMVITVISYYIKRQNNRPCKHFMREKFQGWYAGEFEVEKKHTGQNTSDIAIEMSIPVMP